MNKLILVISLFFCFLDSKAQMLEWDFGFFGFADNHEYSASDRDSPTLIGLQFSPEVGLLVDSTHRVRFGVNILHEFGSSKISSKINPTIYYNYTKKSINFYMGVFPRVGLVDGFSRALLSDTLQYYRPNLSGMLFRYEKKHIFQQVWIDWNSKQTETQREQFLVGLSGNVKVGDFSFGHEAVLWHNALPKNHDATIHLQDNAALIGWFGMNLSPHVKLDSLALSVGGLFSFSRDRSLGYWTTPKGLIVEGHIAYKAFYIHDVLYIGESQAIALGDSFYSESKYNRLDLGWEPFRKNRLSAKLVLSFHFTPGAIDNQQALNLRYNIGAKHKLKDNWY
ncbi:hypothetical protein [Albibacterium bauzanense]|uniref:Uncharacterized protein n=1 Tax=Albibacterium bauzanense TaxID=653929 RepID=A0A4R1M7G2_9SPHI|nr:hypothetical protein [Albibacterium bauzanense]TCK85779.1 hypothetical protein C8N28_1095 [Albibacterium bauzanense]